MSFFITAWVCSFLKFDSFAASFSSDSASIWVAKIAAFFAPAFPIAIEATGTPGGICTVLRRASSPQGPEEACIGTPMIGRGVLPARAPARCAAIPAAAMTTFMPFSAAVSAKSAAILGVRWAEIILTLGSMPKSRSWEMQLFIMFMSLSEPITIATVEVLFSVVIVFSP